MKKVIFALVIATSLVACGGNGSTETTATDSTNVATDSTTVTADTTAVAPATDSAAVK